MIRYFFICLAVFIFGCLAQQFIYGIQLDYGVGKILLLPLFFFCIASVQNYVSTLFFAFIMGLLWDADHCLTFQDSPISDVPPVDNLRFGYSIFLFGIMGFVMKLLQAVIAFRGLLISTVLVFLCLLTYLLLEGMLFYFVRGAVPSGSSILRFILESSGYTSLMAPLLLVALGVLWKLLKIDLDNNASSLITLLKKDTLE